MSKLIWDAKGERFYETGIRKVALYLQDATGAYPTGVAWNGVTSINESPSGADVTDLYADDIKYASFRAAETFGATVETYHVPDEFMECDGTAELSAGVYIGQQKRRTFGLAYQTQISNDVEQEIGYKLHLIYGASASPSEKSYQTINESPDAATFSYELSTTPVEVKGHKPTSIITIDSTKVDATKLAALEAIVYGSDGGEGVEGTVARLPLPDEVATIFSTGSTGSTPGSTAG